MADTVFTRPGTNRGPTTVDQALFHDNGDGSYDLAEGAHLRGWDLTDLKWYKLPVDHATGALLVKATLAAGSIDIGLVDQGAAGASAWKVDGSTGTFPITAAALPLPTGAATGAKQDTGNTSLASIDTKLTAPLSVAVSNFPATQPVSAAALPLPTGAATDATFTAAVGSTSDAPAAYTVLDQLKRIRLATEANTKAAQALLANSQPTRPVAASSTLLHRR